MKSILIVEDDPLTAEVMGVTVRPAFQRVDIVDTLGQAMGAIQTTPYDVVLLDLKLPDSSFDQTLAAIADMKRRGAPNVIIVTGSPVDDRLLQAGIGAGAIDVIGKDIDLKRRLESLLI